MREKGKKGWIGAAILTAVILATCLSANAGSERKGPLSNGKGELIMHTR